MGGSGQAEALVYQAQCLAFQIFGILVNVSLGLHLHLEEVFTILSFKIQ